MPASRVDECLLALVGQVAMSRPSLGEGVVWQQTESPPEVAENAMLDPSYLAAARFPPIEVTEMDDGLTFQNSQWCKESYR